MKDLGKESDIEIEEIGSHFDRRRQHTCSVLQGFTSQPSWGLTVYCVYCACG